MIINISASASELGFKAASFVSQKLNEALSLKGEARMVVSTGSSQFETFQVLLKEMLDWSKIEVFANEK